MTQTTRQRAEELVDAMGNLGVRNRRAKKIALVESLILRERAEAVAGERLRLAAIGERIAADLGNPPRPANMHTPTVAETARLYAAAIFGTAEQGDTDAS